MSGSLGAPYYPACSRIYSLAVIWLWRVIMGPRKYCATILLPRTSPVFHCWDQAFWTVGFLGYSSWCREQCEGWFIWPYHTRVSSYLMSGSMVMTLSFMQLSFIFNNQRFGNCNPTIDVVFVKITSGSSCGNDLQDEYSVLLSYHLCCSTMIFLNSPAQCMTISVFVDFCLLFLFTDVVFPWFVYASITLETVNSRYAS
jgi:hypothetical protein